MIINYMYMTLVERKIMREHKRLKKAFAMLGPLYRELQPGIHTYHQCSCGDRPVRGSKCYMCLLREFMNECNDA